MKSLTKSYLGVNYELRPAKQVERRMIVDGLQLLAAAGVQIVDYQYTGLGSVYFVDFALFHRFLGIKKMLSAEGDPTIEKRVHFNRPFACVDISMALAGDIIATLSRDVKHVLWLDYDDRLLEEHLRDVRLAVSHLSPGSIFLVTVDVEPPDAECIAKTGGGDQDEGTIPGPEDWYEYYRRQANDLFDGSWSVGDFGADNIPAMNQAILVKAIESGLIPRRGPGFLPIFNFRYGDGHAMLTLGGMLGADEERRVIRGSGLSGERYARLTLKDEPFEIRVPRITRRERHYLDRHMPCPDGWCPTDFELSPEEVAAYRDIYRFFPAYGELLL